MIVNELNQIHLISIDTLIQVHSWLPCLLQHLLYLRYCAGHWRKWWVSKSRMLLLRTLNRLVVQVVMGADINQIIASMGEVLCEKGAELSRHRGI